MTGSRFSSPRALTASVAAGLALAAAAITPASASPTRSTCNGRGVDRSALIRYETDVVIDAPLSTIWRLQTDVERWPAWQAPVLTSERIDHGPLRAGSSWQWTTPAPATAETPETTLTITSTVQQTRRNVCILWRGPATGEGLHIDEGVHLWTFTEIRGRVHVHTEETWTGDQVEAAVPLATQALGQGLEQWVDDLKSTAESH